MSDDSNTISVLHVDDERDFAERVSAVLERADDRLVVETATRASEGFEYLTDNEVDCIVSDYDMADWDGIEFLNTVREEYDGLPFIFYTGQGSEKIASQAISAGVTDYLRKEGGSDQSTVLANRITDAVQQYRDEHERPANQKGLSEGVEQSPPVTDRKEHHEQSTVHLETLFENSPDMINIHTPDGTIVDVNRQFCEALDQSEDALLGRKVWEIDEQIEAEVAREIWADMDVSDRIKFETEFRRDDGTQFPVEVHVTRLPFDDGDRFMVISRDISERRQRLEEIRTLKERLELAVEGAGLGVWDWDMRTDRVEFNERWASMIGHSLDQIEPHLDAWESRVHPDDLESVYEVLEAHINAETSYYETEHRMRTADGDWKWIRDIGRIVERDDDNEPVRAVGIHLDIDEQKKRERALEQQNQRLEQFARIVSHDLRNPLSVAHGRVELVRDECESEHLDAIERAHERMETLIDDLLILARVGESSTELTAVEISALIAQCWATVETEDATLVTDIERTIRADESRLRQVFENLIRNSVEHAGEDVTITVGELVNGFYFEDDGPGIPSEERDKVFETGYSTSPDGTGFGLSIVKQVVESHSWDIHVTEGTDGGARFEITGVGSTVE